MFWVRGVGARVSDIFLQTIQIKQNIFSARGGEGEGEGLEKVIFFTENPNLKKMGEEESELE